MKYPVAKPKPTAVTFGRVSYTDSYQWLEEETPEALEFKTQQDKITQDWLFSNPARVRAEALMAPMPFIESDFPIFSGGRWFRKRTPDGQKLQVVEVAEALESPWHVIVDLNAVANGRKLNVDVFVPSPDGRKLLLGYGVDGVGTA